MELATTEKYGVKQAILVILEYSPLLSRFVVIVRRSEIDHAAVWLVGRCLLPLFYVRACSPCEKDLPVRVGAC